MDSGPQSGSSSTLSSFVSGTFADGVWTRSDGTDIASLSTIIINGRVLLFFASITLRHAGEYIYTVTTDAGTDSATFVLEVIGELWCALFCVVSTMCVFEEEISTL